MKKLVLLIAMMLAIAGVYAQGVDFTVNKALKKDYFKVQISITSGVAPFDITFNGRHLDQYSLFAQYDVPNIITITDANNNSKTDTIYEANPHFSWDIGYFENDSESPTENGMDFFHSVGITIGCTFDHRESYIARCNNVSNGENFAHCFGMSYWSNNNCVEIYLIYQVDQVPIGRYSITIRDSVYDMDTIVFITITDPNDTTTTDTTTTDTTTTDTTQHLNVTITQVDEVEFYPNPTISYCNTSELLHEVYVLDNVGRRLRKYTHTNKIDLLGLPAGSYLIRYTTLNGTTNTKKIIKE